MSSHEDRLRLQNERLEHGRKLYSKHREQNPLEELGTLNQLSKEQELLRKQHERLENEKRYNKNHSYLTRDRQLSGFVDQKSKSTHATPDFTNVKSKLFDFQKSAPRSRRQLMDSGGRSSDTSPLFFPRATHAIEATKVSNRDIIDHIAISPGLASRDESRASSKSQTRVPSVMETTDLERQASKRHISHADNKDLEGQASKRHMGHPDNKVHFQGGSILPKIETDTEVRLTNMTVSTQSSPRQQPEPSPRRYDDTRLPSITIEDIDDSESDTKKLQQLYNKAIETVAQADESIIIGQSPSAPTRVGKERRHSEVLQRSGLDVAALKELETILKDARLYSSRKSSKEDHSRLDLGTNRAQKKRIEHLEQVLKQLDPNYGGSNTSIDPMDVLRCSYLRLSRSNIETLEGMVRASGNDPGIHIHSDVTNIDIWKDIESERADLKEKKQANKTKAPKKLGPTKSPLKV